MIYGNKKYYCKLRTWNQDCLLMTTVSILSMWYGMPNGMNTVDKTCFGITGNFVSIYVFARILQNCFDIKTFSDFFFFWVKNFFSKEIDEELLSKGHFSFCAFWDFSKVQFRIFRLSFSLVLGGNISVSNWATVSLHLLEYVHYCCVKSHSVFRSSGWMLPVLPTLLFFKKKANFVV